MHKQKIESFDKGPIRRSLFDNGLTVIQHHAEGFAGARVNINFLAGSMFEDTDQYGMAHFLEHLLFKENESNHLRTMEMAGAELNAYTYKENICFELSVLASKLENVIFNFLHLVCSFDVSEEQFRKEKKVILQEIAEDLDEHESMGIEHIFEKNFGKALGHPIGGQIGTIKKFNRGQLVQFFKKFFKPSRMIITIVSGDIHPGLDQLVGKEVIKLLGSRKAKPYRPKTSKNSKKINHFKSSSKKSVESAILFYSFNGPSINASDYYQYVVLDEILFEGLTSQFFKRFREENAYVYGLGSSLNPFANTGNYMMIFNTQPEHIRPIQAGVLEVIKKIIDEGVNEYEVDQIKSRILDNWAIGLDSLYERIELIQDNEIYSLDEYNALSLKLKLDQVSSKSIQKLCKKLYGEEHSIYKIIPKESK